MILPSAIVMILATVLAPSPKAPAQDGIVPCPSGRAPIVRRDGSQTWIYDICVTLPTNPPRVRQHLQHP